MSVSIAPRFTRSRRSTLLSLTHAGSYKLIPCSVLTQLIDFLTSDMTTNPAEPREVLVGVMRAAVKCNSPSTVRHVLNYAKVKWSEEELQQAASCLCGSCECLFNCQREDLERHGGCECCNWLGCSMRWTKGQSPCTLLLSFLLARTEITDLLAEFAEGLGVRARHKLCPHLVELEDDDEEDEEEDEEGDLMVCLLRATSAGDEEEVRTLLAKGADPNGETYMDEYCRTPLMHAIYHRKPGMVTDLLQAGASLDQSLHICSPADLVVISSAYKHCRCVVC